MRGNIFKFKELREQKNFYYDLSSRPLNKEEFNLALRALKVFLSKTNVPYTVAGIVFEHAESLKRECAIKVENWRQTVHLYFIAQGLTIAWTHPENGFGMHTDGNKYQYPVWSSAVPVLMLRRLDKGDEPFMITEVVKCAFALGMNYCQTIKSVVESNRPIPISCRLDRGECNCRSEATFSGFGVSWQQSVVHRQKYGNTLTEE